MQLSSTNIFPFSGCFYKCIRLIIGELLYLCTNFIGSITICTKIWRYSNTSRYTHEFYCFWEWVVFRKQLWIICKSYKSFMSFVILTVSNSHCCSQVLFTFPVSSNIALKISAHRYIVYAHVRFQHIDASYVSMKDFSTSMHVMCPCKICIFTYHHSSCETASIFKSLHKTGSIIRLAYRPVQWWLLRRIKWQPSL